MKLFTEPALKRIRFAPKDILTSSSQEPADSQASGGGQGSRPIDLPMIPMSNN